MTVTRQQTARGQIIRFRGKWPTVDYGKFEPESVLVAEWVALAEKFHMKPSTLPSLINSVRANLLDAF